MKKSRILIGIVAVLAVFALTGCNKAEVAALMEAGTVLAQTQNFTYETFSEAEFNALKGKQAFAVFVHNRSCGTCAKKDRQIVSEVADFSGGKILKMEYSEMPDSFGEAYGVKKYDTFVIFDAAGNHTTKRGADVEEVRNSIN